jgi:hypothetical protein
MRILMLVFVTLVACGGGKKSAARPDHTPGSTATETAPGAGSDANADETKDGTPAPTGSDPCQGGEQP